jgi:hypothetical protein
MELKKKKRKKREFPSILEIGMDPPPKKKKPLLFSMNSLHIKRE